MSVVEYVGAIDWTTTFGAGGLLDWANSKISSTSNVLRAFSGLAAILFVIVRAIKTQGAVSAIVIAGLCAGGFVWTVFNVTSIKDRVGTEVNSTVVFDAGSISDRLGVGGRP